MASAAAVVLPTESVVLISMSWRKMLRASLLSAANASRKSAAMASSRLGAFFGADQRQIGFAFFGDNVALGRQRLPIVGKFPAIFNLLGFAFGVFHIGADNQGCAIPIGLALCVASVDHVIGR